jgi:O-antigen/teichoic acid export membrane protein
VEPGATEDAAPPSGSPENVVRLARALSRDIAIYTVGTVAANAILYLSIPIYTRAFAPSEYSQFAFVTAASGLLGGVLILGGDTALARFWFKDETLAARRSLCLTWVGFLAIWAAVVCALLIPASPAIADFTLERQDAADLFVLALVTLPLAQTSRMLAQILRNEFRPVPFVVTGVVLGVATLVLGVLLAVGLDLGIAGILLGMLLAETAVLVARTVLTRDLLRGPVDPRLLGSLLRFGVPLVPVTLSFWVFTAADRLVVGKVAGLTELGYYSVAVSVTMVFVVLTSAVSQAWLPRALQLYESDRPLAARAVGASLTYYVLGLGLLATTVAALAPEVTAVLAGGDYAPAAEAMPLLCMGSVLYGSQSITAAGLTVTHRTGLLAVISMVAAVINVVAAVALVPVGGIVGASAAAVIGYGALTTGYLVASQRAWRVDLEVRRLVVLFVLLAAAATYTTLRVDDPLALRLLVPLGFLGVFVLAGGVRAHERAALRRLRTLVR